MTLYCPTCETGVEENNYREKYLSPFNNQEYKLYHCKNCDLQWWEPLKIIPEFYESGFLDWYKVMHMGILAEIDENHKCFFKYFPLKGGKLLDVGCGDGRFLVEAQKRGFEVWGIDFDRKSIQVCQEKRGLKNTFVMAPQEFADFCQREGIKFDAITFFEVLEHQDKPKEFLDTIKSMLKPGGYIAGSVPNRNGFITKLFRRAEPMIDLPPHHFLRFSNYSLKKLLESMGYKNSFTSEVPISITEISALFQTIITGSSVTRFFKKSILRNDVAGEGTSLYKAIPLHRRLIFKILKTFRTTVFLPIALPVKIASEGDHLYFQAQYEGDKYR